MDQGPFDPKYLDNVLAFVIVASHKVSNMYLNIVPTINSPLIDDSPYAQNPALIRDTPREGCASFRSRTHNNTNSP